MRSNTVFLTDEQKEYIERYSGVLYMRSIARHLKIPEHQVRLYIYDNNLPQRKAMSDKPTLKKQKVKEGYFNPDEFKY